MDVLTSYAMSVRPRGGEQDCAVQLLEYLGAKRRKYGKRLSSACRQDGSKLRRLLKRAQRKLVNRVVPGDNKKAPAAEPPISVLELGSELGSIPRLNRSNLHPFRLKVKELRNVVKMAEAPDQDLVDQLGAVKDAIGEWHDWEELVVIAEKALDHGPSCKMMQELKKTAREKYDRALAEAEQLRKKYLGSRERTGLRRSRPGASETVMRAAMKLAA
jgi:CHAD domain-containing protein